MTASSWSVRATGVRIDVPGLPGWLEPLATGLDGVNVRDLTRFVPPPEGGRDSAVLILLGHGPQGPDVLLIQRASDMRAHAGQPAFPGGARDRDDVDAAAAALREAEEETGLVVERGIFDLDRHVIPARGAVPAHWHWDVRYVVRCTVDETPKINRESSAFAWRAIHELAGDGSLDPSIRRMAAFWLAR